MDKLIDLEKENANLKKWIVFLNVHLLDENLQTSQKQAFRRMIEYFRVKIEDNYFKIEMQ